MRKHIACIGAVGLLGGALAPSALGYTIPTRPAGTPGGPCTAAVGGSAASRRDVTALCNRSAAFTGSELSLKEGIRVTMHYPTRGVLKCFGTGTANGVTARLGSARQAWPPFASQKAKRGALDFDFIFGDTGGRFLDQNSVAGEQLNWSCTWTPRGGTAETSTASDITQH